MKMPGPRWKKNDFPLFPPHFLCSSTKRMKDKNQQFFKNQEKLKLIPKHCDSMNFVMIINQGCYTIKILKNYKKIRDHTILQENKI